MSMATFASKYRVIYGKNKATKNKNENLSEEIDEENTATPIIELQNNKGFIKKRTKSQGAVIRYARFSPYKNPEQYYRSQLELFFPYWNAEELKPEPFEKYEHFYKMGNLEINSEVMKVKDIVDSNRRKFEKDIDDLENAQACLDENGIYEDAWGSMCPIVEQDRAECTEERKSEMDDENVNELNENNSNDMPDFMPTSEMRFEKRYPAITKKAAISLLKSMNDTQTAVFYKIREWCLQKVRTPELPGIHAFISGAGGTGKSTLIKCIYCLLYTSPSPRD